VTLFDGSTTGGSAGSSSRGSTNSVGNTGDGGNKSGDSSQNKGASNSLYQGNQQSINLTINQTQGKAPLQNLPRGKSPLNKMVAAPVQALDSSSQMVEVKEGETDHLNRHHL
jgi:hypothetical protein